MRLIIQESKNACHRSADREMREEDKESGNECAARRDEDRPRDEILDHLHVRMHAWLHHVEHAFERRVHEFEREDEGANDREDGAFIGGKWQIPGKKSNREGDRDFEMKIALLTDRIGDTGKRVAETAKKLAHGNLFLLSGDRCECIGHVVLDLEHPLLVIETDQVEDAVRKHIRELALP